MAKKSPRGPRRNEKQWTAIFKRFEGSGLSSRDFCRHEGLALSSFQRWHRRLGSAASSDFLELVPAAPSSVGPAGWSFEVTLPNGVSLRFQG